MPAQSSPAVVQVMLSESFRSMNNEQRIELIDAILQEMKVPEGAREAIKAIAADPLP